MEQEQRPVVDALRVDKGVGIAVGDNRGSININVPPSESDKQAFDKGAAVDTAASVIRFSQPPDEASLRHLARFRGKWTLSFEWKTGDDPLAPDVLQGKQLPNIIGIHFKIVPDFWLNEIAKPDSGFTSLERLDFGNSWNLLKDSAVKEITRPDGGLKSLTSLCFFNTDVADAGLKELTRPDCGLTALARLNLSQTPRLSETGLRELARPDSGLKALTSLQVSHNVTDATLRAFVRPDTALRGLTYLQIFALKVSDEGLAELGRADSGLNSLKSLELMLYSDTADAGLLSLARPGSGLGGLTSLSVRGIKSADALIGALASPDSGLARLESLEINASETVTDEGLAILARSDGGLKSLTSIKLDYGGYRATKAGVAALRAARPGLMIDG